MSKGTEVKEKDLLALLHQVQGQQLELYCEDNGETTSRKQCGKFANQNNHSSGEGEF